jgi:peptide/nickel transport system substrate-binding protein
MKTTRFKRALAAVIVALGPVGATTQTSRLGLGQEPPAIAAGPAISDPLRSIPFDRLTLTDGTVLIIDPVSPRPLPATEPTRSDTKVRLKGINTEIPLEGNIGLLGEPSKFKTPSQEKAEKEQYDDPNGTVKIHLLQEAEVRDFLVKRSRIKNLEYFEDLLLAEGDRLVLARDFARAFECYLRVRSRNPSWAGLDDHVNRLLFAEGSAALIGGDAERGLRLLRELLSRDRGFPGLLDQLASAYSGWIARALELGKFAQGRRFLHELEEMAPEHPVVRGLRDRFIARATEHVKEAEARSGPERLDALLRALRVWPALPGAESLYTRAFESVPTLDVAVSDVPRPFGPWLRSPADMRVSRLLYRPILSSDSDDAKAGKAPGQLAAALETKDLGRRLFLRLRDGIHWSDQSRQVAAADVARALIDRSDPNSLKYQARWADLLDRVETNGDAAMEVRLNRPLYKPGAWFDWPVGPAHAGIDGRVATVEQRRQLVSDGPFQHVTSSDHSIELSRGNRAIAGSLLATKVASVRRIREFRYPHATSMIGALVQGEVSMAAHVPIDQIPGLQSSGDVKIGRYAQPLIHTIALDGRNPVLRNRSLRRGLSHAIDRRVLLEETLLRRPPDAENAVADGPFPKGSYADAPGVKPLEHSTSLSVMLVAAARKEMGGAAIELKFEYPAIAEAQAVVPLIAEAFRFAGLRIATIEHPESDLETELRAGRRFDLVYRAVRCSEPVLDAGLLLCPGYDATPDSNALASATSTRILQLLLQLERAADVPSARGLVIQIDRETRDELPVLPLWQLVDHFAWRSRLTGPANVADQLYEGIEAWEIKPWIAKDPWTTR